MKKQVYQLSLPLVLCLVMAAGSLSAQVVVSGELVVSPSAELYVQDDLVLQGNARLANAGILELHGDFTAQGQNIDHLGGGRFRLAGVQAQQIELSGDTLSTVEVANAAGLDGANVVIADSLIFSPGSGRWRLGSGELRLLSAAHTAGAGAGSYLETNGSGRVLAEAAGAQLLSIPVGTVTAYAPLELLTNGANTLAVAVKDNMYANPEALTGLQTENGVELHWQVEAEQALNATDIALHYPQSSELTLYDRTEANLLQWQHGVSQQYVAASAVTTGGNPYRSSLSASFSMAADSVHYLALSDNESPLNYLQLTAACFLEGAFNGTDMNTALSAGGSTSILATQALNQPYQAAPWNYAGTESVNAAFFNSTTDVVDWLLVELRDATDPSVIVAQAAVFLRADGSIINTAEQAFANLQAAPDQYYVAIRHRNHADIRSANPLDLSQGNSSFDVRSSNTGVHGTTNLKLSGSNYLLYAGDGDGNNDITSQDQTLWVNDNGKNGQYLIPDFNLNSDVTSQDQSVWLINNGLNITPLF